MQNELYDFQEEDKIDVKEVLFKYLRFWPLYISGIVIALLIARIQLRYAPNIYSSYATIKILDQSKAPEIDLSGLTDNNLFDKGVNLENEIEILRSKRLLLEVVEELDLETEYFSKGQLRMSELWGSNIPFRIHWYPKDSLSEIEASILYTVFFLDGNHYTLSDENGMIKEKVAIGELVQHGSSNFRLAKREGHDYQVKADNGTIFSFQYAPGMKRAAGLSRQLIINQVGKGSELLMLGLNGPVKEKNEEIINMIIQKFDQDGQNDRKLVSERTEEFVSNRLVNLVGELDSIEGSLVSYKQNTETVDIQLDATKYTQREDAAFSEETAIAIQYLITKEYKKSLEASDSFDLLPANFGLDDKFINEAINAHNSIVLERQKYLLSSTKEHPRVKLLERQIVTSKLNIISGLYNYEFGLQDKLEKIKKMRLLAEGSLNTIPNKEKILRNIARQQSIKENLYLFLLEKRESASLTSAVTAPSVKVVDYAYTTSAPISPTPKTKYTIFFFIGLIIPLGFVYLRYLLNTKIYSKDDIIRALSPVSLPVIGEIPQIQKTEEFIIGVHDRSELAEAFRVVRTNLSYLDVGLDSKQSRVYMVTSSTKSEGKTFTSINTAITLATSKHKVLLVGADLRNPQLHQYLDLNKNTAGLTTYLHEADANINSLIHKNVFGFDHLDVMLSGYIPPNPAELLLNGRFEHFLNEVKQVYDYIIIDSAPTLLVTDSLLIAKYVDVAIYLIRAGVTDIKIMEHIANIHKGKKLPHLGLILNGIGKNGSYGYGYKYNYGYGYTYSEDKKKKKFWEGWKIR